MVTRSQIDKLGSRIEALAVALSPPELQTTYAIYLSFTGETDDEFHARYPDLPRPWQADVVLGFDDPQMHAGVPQPQMD
jgi:hypothetical protein